jgi:hypothetical protein
MPSIKMDFRSAAREGKGKTEDRNEERGTRKEKNKDGSAHSIFLALSFLVPRSSFFVPKTQKESTPGCGVLSEKILSSA